MERNEEKTKIAIHEIVNGKAVGQSKGVEVPNELVKQHNKENDKDER